MALAEKKKPWVEYNWLSENCGLKVSNICLGTMTFGKASKVGIHYLFCLAFSMTFRRWCSRVQGSNSGATRYVEGLELIIIIVGLFALIELTRPSAESMETVGIGVKTGDGNNTK